MDLFEEDQFESLIEDDEINSWEEGFMRGYDEDLKLDTEFSEE